MTAADLMSEKERYKKAAVQQWIAAGQKDATGSMVLGSGTLSIEKTVKEKGLSPYLQIADKRQALSLLVG